MYFDDYDLDFVTSSLTSFGLKRRKHELKETKQSLSLFTSNETIALKVVLMVQTAIN